MGWGEVQVMSLFPCFLEHLDLSLHVALCETEA